MSCIRISIPDFLRNLNHESLNLVNKSILEIKDIFKTFVFSRMVRCVMDVATWLLTGIYCGWMTNRTTWTVWGVVHVRSGWSDSPRVTSKQITYTVKWITRGKYNSVNNGNWNYYLEVRSIGCVRYSTGPLG